KRVAQLVAVFFHLVMFGVVALIASIGFSPDAGVPEMLSRIGIILLLTAVGHGITIIALARLRDQQTETGLAEAQIAAEENARRFPRSRPGQPRDGAIDTGRGRETPPKPEIPDGPPDRPAPSRPNTRADEPET